MESRGQMSTASTLAFIGPAVYYLFIYFFLHYFFEKLRTLAAAYLCGEVTELLGVGPEVRAGNSRGDSVSHHRNFFIIKMVCKHTQFQYNDMVFRDYSKIKL